MIPYHTLVIHYEKYDQQVNTQVCKFIVF